MLILPSGQQSPTYAIAPGQGVVFDAIIPQPRKHVSSEMVTTAHANNSEYAYSVMAMAAGFFTRRSAVIA